MSDYGEFLKHAGWEGADIVPLPGDASTRRYARLIRGGWRAMLMDQPQNAESAVAAAGAGEAERRALGYNAVARLAGGDVRRFAAVTAFLRAQGLAAPDIHAADFAHGLLILEDLGDALFTEVIGQGVPEADLYKGAVEVLARLHRTPAPSFLPVPTIAGSKAGDESPLPLFAYDDIALVAETDLMLEWFFPLALGRPASDSEVREHRGLWRAALAAIQSDRPVFIHRDYHAQNLFWLPARTGLSRIGVIDFQDAVAGSIAYDLISLTEDARRDVSPELAETSTAHYLDAMRMQGMPLDEARLRAEMAVMAAQRNTKIVGIFARLYARDGKRRYLSYLPRVWSYLERDLAHHLLADLRGWYDRVIPKTRRTLPELESA
jgi:N-acetylmuramate 1-kinase